jgi:hypothetical protein
LSVSLSLSSSPHLSPFSNELKKRERHHFQPSSSYNNMSSASKFSQFAASALSQSSSPQVPPRRLHKKRAFANLVRRYSPALTELVFTPAQRALDYAFSTFKGRGEVNAPPSAGIICGIAASRSQNIGVMVTRDKVCSAPARCSNVANDSPDS